ncbi:hypothetical protein LCGC14_2172130 [marine sediment metagenome]|uniref:Uncharacterized protein n=1 Tax=marine sediment metagenome TaxID=412755 RepID=A0A0F9DPU5_9ZZZZ
METKTDKTVAIEILRQLGGNRFIAMTGAKNFVCDNSSMSFQIPQTMTRDRISHIKITLNSMDTYDIKYFNIRGVNIKIIDTFEGVYNDMLQEVISNRTGLNLVVCSA